MPAQPTHRERIRAALQQAEAAEPSAAATAAAISPVDCCTQQHDAPTAGRPHRALLLPVGLRRLHQAILRHFAATAAAPGPADLATFASAAGWEVATALERLEHEDLIAVDATGRLIAAYPNQQHM